MRSAVIRRFAKLARRTLVQLERTKMNLPAGSQLPNRGGFPQNAYSTSDSKLRIMAVKVH
jgi:hypothetical protein